MRDAIALRNLRLVGAHGVLADEQQRAQPFEVDVVVHGDLSVPGLSDRLEDTIDYGNLCSAVAAVVSGPHCNLLEHLAQKIADAAFALTGPRAEEVTVTVRKLRPPVPHDLACSEVTISRTAAEPR